MFFLALRHLFSKKKQTLLTLLGILLGTMAYVAISAFFLGFQGFLVNQLLNNDAHLRVSAKEEFVHADSVGFLMTAPVFWVVPPSGRRDNARITHPGGWYQRLDSDPRVSAYAPQFSVQAIARLARASAPMTLYGTDPSKLARITNLSDYILEGSLSELASGGGRLLAGKDFLQKLGAKVGDVLLVSASAGQPLPFKVVASFHTGMRQLDNGSVYTSLSDAQQVNQTPGEINLISVRLKDPHSAQRVAEAWSSTTEDKVESWEQLNANVLSVFKIQNAIRFMTTLMILIVAGFGIYNVMNMIVSQKRKEVAILRAMGFEQRDIVTLFLFQGLALGISGGLLGLALGYGISSYLETVPFSGGPSGSSTGFMQISFSPAIYLSGMALALLSSGLASILPARAAARLTPIEIIRSGTE